MLNNTQNESSKFRIRNWVEINDESQGTYNKRNQIKFKTSIIRSTIYDYSDVDILVSGTITVTGSGDDDDAKRAGKRNKGVLFRNCARITDCVSNKINTQIDNVKGIDAMMSMYNLIEYSDNYLKTSGRL